MIYLAMVTACIISFINNIAVVFPTSGVINGVCYAYMIWNSKAASMFYFTWNFVAFYLIIIFIFVFCYWRIIVVIRRQARVMASHAVDGSSAAQIQCNQIQSNVIKTMIIVSTSFAISWLPAYIHFMIQTLTPYPIPLDAIFFAGLALAYSYMCINPYIYATNLDPVRQVLLRLLPCKKISEQAAGNVAWPMELTTVRHTLWVCDEIDRNLKSDSVYTLTIDIIALLLPDLKNIIRQWSRNAVTSLAV